MTAFRKFPLTPDEGNRDLFGTSSSDVPKLLYTLRQVVDADNYQDPIWLRQDFVGGLSISRDADIPVVAIVPNNVKETILLSVDAPILLPMRGPIKIIAADGYRPADNAYTDLLGIDVWETAPRAFPLTRAPKRKAVTSESVEGSPSALTISTRRRRRAQIVMRNRTGGDVVFEIKFVWSSQGPGQSPGFSAFTAEKVIDSFTVTDGNDEFAQYDWGTSGGPGIAPDYIVVSPDTIDCQIAAEVMD